MVAFQKKFWEFNRAVEGALNFITGFEGMKMDILIYAIKQVPEAPNTLMDNALKIKKETDDILQHLFQGKTLADATNRLIQQFTTD